MPISIMQLQMMILLLVLIASGLIPAGDIAFSVFASIYFVLMNKLVFPSSSMKIHPKIFPGSKILGPYVAMGGIVGLLLPLGYILGSFVQGDRRALSSASPHLFFLACQVLTETVAAKTKGTSLPVRGLVPIFYNTRRLFSIASWLKSDFNKGVDSVGLDGMSTPLIGVSNWILFGRGLAVANMVFWWFNLFCFLLPMYLPRVMKKHYELERVAKEHQT